MYCIIGATIIIVDLSIGQMINLANKLRIALSGKEDLGGTVPRDLLDADTGGKGNDITESKRQFMHM